MRATSRRISLFNPFRTLWEVRHRGVPMGVNAKSGRPIYLPLERLFTHLWLIGPPGSGKTRVLLHLFQVLCQIPRATVVLLSPKGALGHMARDWAITMGLTARLELFDPGEADHILVYNNLQRNGSPIGTHAKALRENLRAGWGQPSFDVTPQMARVLQWSLHAALELGLTYSEVIELLRPRSELRRRLVPQIKDPYIQDALRAYDALDPRRAEELAASACARLEGLVHDPMMRAIFTHRGPSLSMEQVVREGRILIGNFEEYRPMLPDDVVLVLRTLVNDLVAHTFRRRLEERARPVFLLMDEAHEGLTADLCRAVSMGRELRLSVIAANQFSGQFRADESTRELAEAFANCVRTRIVFGGLSVRELREHHIEDLFLDQVDPRRVKDEVWHSETIPHETTRQTTTVSHSRGQRHGLAWPQSEADGENCADTKTRGRHTDHSLHRDHTVATAVADGHTERHTWSESQAEAAHEAESEGEHDTENAGHTSARGGPWGALIHDEWTEADTTSAGRGRTRSRTTGRSEIQTRSIGGGIDTSRVVTQQQGLREGTSTTTGTNEQDAHQEGRSRVRSRGVTPSVGVEEAATVARSVVPFHELHSERTVSSRTFYPIDEQLTEFIQAARGLKKGYILQGAGKPAAFVRAPRVPDPYVSPDLLRQAREEIFSRPHYTRPEIVEEAERRRREELLGSATPTPRLPWRRNAARATVQESEQENVTISIPKRARRRS